MQNPSASTTVRRFPRGPMIWSGVDRVIACDRDGDVVGTFDSISDARRALAGAARRRLPLFAPRPRYARSAT
ncbi:hypothetical protein ELQ90_09915 [Labedella phragmitis]|uniref:Uncharacterized protein n=1 Tax=Labedella phragmitis TaxID=2498849 RepID=A0A444PTC1_9MICO|nr:hypothetical protein [Labedella phragmitis]RWZ51099.1 hypothetical protein ELQ90_09915 [Labedella phragmitis]